MQIWKCDMCGKPIEHDYDTYHISVGFPSFVPGSHDKEGYMDGISYQHYDLCKACCDQVVNVLDKTYQIIMPEGKPRGSVMESEWRL